MKFLKAIGAGIILAWILALACGVLYCICSLVIFAFHFRPLAGIAAGATLFGGLYGAVGYLTHENI